MSVEHLWREVDKHTWEPLDCILKDLSAVVWVNDSLKAAGIKSMCCAAKLKKKIHHFVISKLKVIIFTDTTELVERSEL